MGHSASDYVSAESIEELKSNPYIPVSPTTGEPLRERTQEERRAGRARVAAKAKAEAAAMELQRKRIEWRQRPTFPTADNDNYPADKRVAA